MRLLMGNQKKLFDNDQFIASILELEKHYGSFEFAIGHSLGGMSVLNAIKQNLQVKKQLPLELAISFKTSLMIL